MISKPCHLHKVAGFFAFGKTGKGDEGSMGNNMSCRQNLSDTERRRAVKKVAAASLFTMLSIPTMTVDPIVKTVVRIVTFQFGM